MQEEADAPSCSRSRSSPWPPDLNLESQDTDDEPADIQANNNNSTLLWGLTLQEKKRARSHSPRPWSVGTTDRDEDESKRTRLPHQDPVSTASTSSGGSGSSKVHPLLGSFEDEWRRVTFSERHLFPLGSGGMVVRPSEELPDLELALGAEKRQPGKRGIFPFPLQAAASKSWKRDDGADDGEDELASLSLSLAFPFAAKEPRPPSLMKQPPVGRSFLFDPFGQG